MVDDAAKPPNVDGDAAARGAVTREQVEWAYRLILGREPESEPAIAANLAAGDVAGIRRNFIGSHEFGAAHAELLSRLPSIINFRDEWRASVEAYRRVLEGSGVTLARVEQMYRDAGLGDNEYTRVHLRRFVELFGYLAGRLRPGRRQLLEIGTSPHTSPYFARFVDSDCDTICRPPSMDGPTQEWAAAAGVRRHCEIDLNTLAGFGIDIPGIPDAAYDAVICCEVVEHLVTAPRYVIAMALSKLNEGGFLYLTTPNVLTPEKVGCLFAGRSPAGGFEAYRNNYHAHHHFREYTPLELADEVRLAGGVVRDVILSNCWDHPRYESDAEVMFRSNIVIIATR